MKWKTKKIVFLVFIILKLDCKKFNAHYSTSCQQTVYIFHTHFHLLTPHQPYTITDSCLTYNVFLPRARPLLYSAVFWQLFGSSKFHVNGQDEMKNNVQVALWLTPARWLKKRVFISFALQEAACKITFLNLWCTWDLNKDEIHALGEKSIIVMQTVVNYLIKSKLITS